ncbi:MAG: class I SAM-dependent methyltransferase [Bryobacterales bacterium]|nr:class I SAM-dependent methyltransferase [Bryobacterales bacterium]
MNRIHHWICRSGWWKKFLAQDLIPWALDGTAWGGCVLEIGPGPGLATALLAPGAQSLTCMEVDARLAANLLEKTDRGKVRVLCGDATAMALDSGLFDSVLAFTMLHHVTPAVAQDALFREVARVLRPGGLFAGTDSLDSPVFRMLHWFDDLEPVRPETLRQRLTAAGFDRAEVEIRKREFRFRAWRARA